MVRLKASLSFAACPLLCLFQFQYGAIKSEDIDIKIVIDSKFQFQYGAIKSLPFGEKVRVFFDFNSNMVRLKARDGLTR